MLKAKEERRKDTIRRAVVAQNSLISSIQFNDFENFIEGFYRNVNLDDIADLTPEEVFSVAYGMRSFADKRKSGAAKIRVYNPTIENNGWVGRHTVIEVVNDDMPFLVDSLVAALSQREYTIYNLVHPIFMVKREEDAKIKAVKFAKNKVSGTQLESFIHVQIDRIDKDEDIVSLTESIESMMNDVRNAVKAWQPMQEKLDEVVNVVKNYGKNKALKSVIDIEEAKETVDFLAWLQDHHFTFLGYRYCAYTKKSKTETIVEFSSGLGLLHSEEVTMFNNLKHKHPIPKEVLEFSKNSELLLINKANKRATVHRSSHMDVISVKSFDEKGVVNGEHRFLGLFTSSAYHENPDKVPYLRRKAFKTLDMAGFHSTSHDGKALLHILNTFPRDELFQISIEELYEVAISILQIRDTRRIYLFARKDPYERFVSSFVYIPRDRFNTDLRVQIQEVLESSFKGVVTAYYTRLSDEAFARLHVITKTNPGDVPKYNLDAIEKRITLMSRTWADRLEENLKEELGDSAGAQKNAKYRKAFPFAYQEYFSPQIATSDLRFVEKSLKDHSVQINLYRPSNEPEDTLCLKLYNCGDSIPLSDVLPMLEKLGLKVETEVPFKITPYKDKNVVWIHYFYLRTPEVEVNLPKVKNNFEECFLKVWHNEIENDRLNSLVSSTSLNWREIAIIRAYSKYLKQAGVLYSQEYIEQVLNRNPDIAASLVELFKLYFSPKKAEADEDGEENSPKKAIRSIYAHLEKVTNIDEDRIIRRLLNLVVSTLRTNYFQKNAGKQDKNYISFKFDSTKLDELPLPRPHFEIFVYAPYMEGIHLRGGEVARGGIRWSDRIEDFRTEILGLMKAQMVKNAVIVPVGSKGGFIVKADLKGKSRDEVQQEVIRCYKTLIRGMLDITDNLKNGKVVPPKQVVRRDEDDPYLVVAADKGTATFSDIANEVSRSYDFWLDDAFASGGSQGYDHKKMGITARGAWESVKRHFRELGKDIQSEPFTAVGVGDMSGDVFGNGMLLSRQTRLLAAFNHMHIFVDPDPDPETSYKERERMFKLPRSSWSDYNNDKLSKGGAIYDRSQKSIELSEEVKQLFGLESKTVSPNTLIRAILTADVELLWFGGIGTYVKAETESNADVSDRTNDRLRVNATELRCRIIGEGANLGITQKGRIEFTLQDGHANTDAIDNSAGVDCSDHEVNIKILLNSIVSKSKMTMEARDKLLVKMTDHVAELVLKDNYLQTQAITIEHTERMRLLAEHSRFIKVLENLGQLNREVEFLPNDKVLGERRVNNLGMTRPEISVLLAYSKNFLYDRLIASDLPDDPVVEKSLRFYFPHHLHDLDTDALFSHRLKREIIATHIANSMVNRIGCTFVTEMRAKTGKTAVDVARSYTIVRDAFDLTAIWRDIESYDNKVPTKVQTEMHIETRRLIGRATLWLLRNSEFWSSISEDLDFFASGVAELSESLQNILDEQDQQRIIDKMSYYMKFGIDEDLSRRVGQLQLLNTAFDIVRIARKYELDIPHVGRISFSIGKFFGFSWLRHTTSTMEAQTLWQKSAAAAIVEDLYNYQRALTELVLQQPVDHKKVDSVGVWTASNYTHVRQVLEMLADLKSQEAVDMSMMVVAANYLGELVKTSGAQQSHAEAPKKKK